MTKGEVDDVHHVIYYIVIPILIVIGLVVNTICIIVLARPSLRSQWVNRYFLILAVMDLLVCVFHIPVASTVTGCVYSGYTDAFYFAHFGWTMVGVFQSIGTYVIVWLAMDRFIAVWMYDRYTELLKKGHFLRNRMILTCLMCVVIHLVFIIKGDVTCSKNDPNCQNGQWVSRSGYVQDFDTAWHKVYRNFYAIVIRWIPYVLLIVFNIGLVVGVTHGRVNYPSSQRSGRRGELYLVMTMISITASYIFLTLPIILYVTVFAQHRENRCNGPHPEEILRGIGNTLQLFEHVVHVVFLVCLNHGFRVELRKVFEFCGVKPEDTSRSFENGAEFATAGNGGMSVYTVGGTPYRLDNNNGQNLQFHPSSNVLTVKPVF